MVLTLYDEGNGPPLKLVFHPQERRTSTYSVFSCILKQACHWNQNYNLVYVSPYSDSLIWVCVQEMISLHNDLMKLGKGFRNKRPFPMWGKRFDWTNGTRGFMRSQPLHLRVRKVPWLNETSRGHGPEMIDGGGKLVERGGVGTRHTQGSPLVVVVRKQVFRKQYRELEWFITLLRLYLSATIWRCCRCRIQEC